MKTDSDWTEFNSVLAVYMDSGSTGLFYLVLTVINDSLPILARNVGHWQGILFAYFGRVILQKNILQAIHLTCNLVNPVWSYYICPSLCTVILFKKSIRKIDI